MTSPAAFDPASSRMGLFDALLQARRQHGGERPILEDQDRNALTYTGLIRACFALGRKIASAFSGNAAVDTDWSEF